MTREEQIKLASEDYTERNHQDGLFNDIVEDSFQKGAQWADQHPVNLWHDASKELPEMGGLYLVHNGRTSQTIRYNKEQNKWGVNPWMIINIKYWMEIPELPKEE